jgi:Lipopolysaccharide kinase (Kdo/WaaP) family
MNNTSDMHFDHWLHVEGEWIEPPNHRRGGSSGVIRHQPENGPTLYIKRQQGHLFHSWRYPLGRPTCLREARALAKFQAIGVHVPVLRFFGLKKERLWWGILVTEALPEGFVSFDDFYSRNRAAATLDQREAVVEALATTLARLHKHRWQHCSLMTKHIFVRILTGGEHETITTAQIALLDLERARRQPLALRAARRDLRFLHSHLPYWTEEEWRLFDRHYFLHFGREVVYRQASPASTSLSDPRA